MDKLKTQGSLLIELRGKLQGAFHVQPYKILPNEVIAEILKVQPRTQEELNGVKGLPAEGFRNGKFGVAILTIIKQWDMITSIELVGSNEAGYDVEFGIKESHAFAPK